MNFVSHDRSQSADGKTYRPLPWSTPVRDYRDFAGIRVAAYGEAVWTEPAGEFVYARFELESIEYNVGTRAREIPTEAKGPKAAERGAEGGLADSRAR